MSETVAECRHLWPAGGRSDPGIALCHRCGALIGPEGHAVHWPHGAPATFPAARPVVSSGGHVIDFRRRTGRWDRFTRGWSAGGMQDAVDHYPYYTPEPPQAA